MVDDYGLNRAVDIRDDLMIDDEFVEISGDFEVRVPGDVDGEGLDRVVVREDEARKFGIVFVELRNRTKEDVFVEEFMKGFDVVVVEVDDLRKGETGFGVLERRIENGHALNAMGQRAV